MTTTPPTPPQPLPAQQRRSSRDRRRRRHGFQLLLEPAGQRRTRPRGSDTGARDATYGAPLDALGGQTFAQYLADHQAADPRLA